MKRTNLGKAFPQTIFTTAESSWFERHVLLLALFLTFVALALVVVQLMSLREMSAVLRQVEHLKDAEQTRVEQQIIDYATNCSLDAILCPGEQPAAPETQPQAAGVASWLVYQLADTCAVRDWPRGSILRVSSGEATITCVVRDWGPTRRDRIIDLNLGQFAQLRNPRHGLVNVTITEQ